MTCFCSSGRVVSIFGKHNDLASMSIPHLDFEHDGYMPSFFKPFGGDDFTIEVCMECGTIRNWVLVTDEEITESEEYKELTGTEDADEEGLTDEEEIEELREKQRRRAADKEVNAREPKVFSLVDIRRQFYEKLMISEFGLNWYTNSDAQETLADALESTSGADQQAIRELLKIQ